jgi:hypothetical protein
MSVAPFLFFTGVLLGMFCGSRIVVRAFGFAHLLLGNRPPDSLTEWLASIRLRNTFFLEVCGFLAAMVMIHLAIGLMQGDAASIRRH